MVYAHESKRLYNFIVRSYYAHGNTYNNPEWTGYRDNENDNIHSALIDISRGYEPRYLYYKASEIYN